MSIHVLSFSAQRSVSDLFQGMRTSQAGGWAGQRFRQLRPAAEKKTPGDAAAKIETLQLELENAKAERDQ